MALLLVTKGLVAIALVCAFLMIAQPSRQQRTTVYFGSSQNLMAKRKRATDVPSAA